MNIATDLHLTQRMFVNLTDIGEFREKLHKLQVRDVKKVKTAETRTWVTTGTPGTATCGMLSCHGPCCSDTKATKCPYPPSAVPEPKSVTFNVTAYGATQNLIKKIATVTYTWASSPMTMLDQLLTQVLPANAKTAPQPEPDDDEPADIEEFDDDFF